MYEITLTKYGEPKDNSPQKTNIEKQDKWKVKSNEKPTIIEDIYNNPNINKKYNFSNEEGIEIDSSQNYLKPHIRIELYKHHEPLESISYKKESFNYIHEFINSRIKNEE